jgi:hypothetical protein
MSAPDLSQFHNLGCGSVAGLYMVRVVVEVFATPLATIERAVEEYC